MQNAISISTPTKMKVRNHKIAAIVAEARSWLLESVRSRVPRFEDAEDIVQDVLHQFTGTYDQIRNLEASSAWLYRAASNRISDFYRKRSRTIEGTNRDAVRPSGDEDNLLDNILADTESTPERQFDLEELEQRLESAIDSLPVAQQEVFIWHEIEGLSFKDISTLTGDSVNTLLSRKRYAVMALRKKLQDLNI